MSLTPTESEAELADFAYSLSYEDRELEALIPNVRIVDTPPIGGS